MPFEERYEMDGGRKFRLKIYIGLAICVALGLVFKFAVGSGVGGYARPAARDVRVPASGGEAAKSATVRQERDMGMYDIPYSLSPIVAPVGTMPNDEDGTRSGEPVSLAKAPAFEGSGASDGLGTGKWQGGGTFYSGRRTSSASGADQGASGGASLPGRGRATETKRNTDSDPATKTAPSGPARDDPKAGTDGTTDGSAAKGGAGTGDDDDDDDGDDDDGDDEGLYAPAGTESSDGGPAGAPAEGSVPEPTTMILLAGGAGLVGVWRRRRRR